ncbi:MAG: hypothetical protein M3327_08935 [Actinomycetota bacterium]|nr:hypothetical protein [Actinomycetota bacterium]
MRSALIAGSALAASATVVACGGSHAARSTPPATAKTQATRPAGAFVAAPKELIAACRKTAHIVGYPVPCPTRLPKGLTETGANGQTRCGLDIIGAGGVGECAKSWRGWVVGSSTTGDQHLAITASPKPLRSYAKIVNGPAWYPKARVKPLAWVKSNGWRSRAVFVPEETNDGSAFIHHVVLIWTVGGHTYGVGFHNVRGVQETLTLDEELVTGIKLVGP